MHWSKFGWRVDGDYYIKLPTPQFVDAKGPLILVRTGSSTASAAEGFTDMAYANIAMPWSKLSFSYGTSLYYWDSDYFAEGRGLLLDFYLTGNDTEERLDPCRYAETKIRVYQEYVDYV